MDELQSDLNSRTKAHIESWRNNVVEAHAHEEPQSAQTERTNLINGSPDKVHGDISASNASGETLGDLLKSLLEGINLDSTVELENTAETKKVRTPEKNTSERKRNLREEENNRNEADQQAKKLEEIQRYVAQQKCSAREKAAAQAKQVVLQKDENAILPAESSGAEELDSQPNQQQCRADATVLRCLLSAIPSIAATADILELIVLDTLVKHLGLDIDLSDPWGCVLKRKTAYSSIETFLAECAPDPYAWSVLRREGYFTLYLSLAIRELHQKEDRPKDRESLLTILDSLLEIFNGEVEWEIVPENVPRALIRRAIAVAKDGPDPPNYEWGEDSQIDTFLMMVANKSESSLFGTPNSDNPRYWDYWMQRGGFGSHSS